MHINIIDFQQFPNVLEVLQYEIPLLLQDKIHMVNPNEALRDWLYSKGIMTTFTWDAEGKKFFCNVRYLHRDDENHTRDTHRPCPDQIDNPVAADHYALWQGIARLEAIYEAAEQNK